MNKSNTDLQVEIGEANVLFEWASSILKQLKTITEKEKDRNVEVFVEKTKTLNYHVHEFCKSVDLMINPDGSTEPEAFLKKKKRKGGDAGDKNENEMNDKNKHTNNGQGKNGEGKATSTAGMKIAKEIGEYLTEAHADFSQSNLNGIQAKNVEGVRLPDGNFIFVWRDEGYKKMVLTDNQGDILKAGYVRDAVPGWDNPATWTPSGVDGRWGYTVTNFNGVAKGEDGSGKNSETNQAFNKDGSSTCTEIDNPIGRKDGLNANLQDGQSGMGDGKGGFIVNDDGSITEADGSIIGTIDKNGVIVGKDGSVIGTLQNDGRIMDKNGSIIASESDSMAAKRFQNSEVAKMLRFMTPEQIEYSYGISEEKMHEFYSNQRIYLWLIG